LFDSCTSENIENSYAPENDFLRCGQATLLFLVDLPRSHTHTLVVDPNDKDNVYIYVSGTSFVRQSEELAGCSGEKPDKDPNTALFRIDVIKVPVAAPQDAKIVFKPSRLHRSAYRANERPQQRRYSRQKRNGKARGHRPVPRHHGLLRDWLAAGACSGNGILLDVKDPVHPKRVGRCQRSELFLLALRFVFERWLQSRLHRRSGAVVSALAAARTIPTIGEPMRSSILKDNKLSMAGYYKLPAAQGDSENCVAHNGSLVPVPGRDIEVQAWYQGGISVMDFTDAAHPFEIAYFDRGPIDPSMLVLGGDWSAYWYNGNIYASEIARGWTSSNSRQPNSSRKTKSTPRKP